MKSQDTLSRWLGFSLLFILICIIGYQLWTKWINCKKPQLKEGFNQEVPDYFEELMKTQVENALEMRKETEKPRIKFIYSGYNEIYDYVISKSIYQELHELEKTGNNKRKQKELFSFESIPKLYVYVLEEQPSKIHIVFTKLKKSDNLINLFNKTLSQENVINQNSKIMDKKETNNTNFIIEDNDITNNETDVETSLENKSGLQIIQDLIIKHNLTNIQYDLEDNQEDIKQLIILLSNVNSNILDNLILFPEDNKILKTNQPVTKKVELLKTLSLDKKYLAIFEKANNKNKTFTHKFSNVLLGESNFIFDKSKKDYLFHQESLTNKEGIKDYLFQNNNLGIFISPDRIHTFKINELNTNLIEIYFKISNKKGELNSREIMNKLASSLDIELTKDFLVTNEELSKEIVNNKDESKKEIEDNIVEEENREEEDKIEENTKIEKPINNLKPNLSFYYLHNKFQVVKVVIRPYEKDLIM